MDKKLHTYQHREGLDWRKGAANQSMIKFKQKEVKKKRASLFNIDPRAIA